MLTGVYLPTETYEEMTVKDEVQRREIQELLLKKRAMEDERERMVAVFSQLEEQHARAQDSLADTRDRLDATAAVSTLLRDAFRYSREKATNNVSSLFVSHNFKEFYRIFFVYDTSVVNENLYLAPQFQGPILLACL